MKLKYKVIQSTDLDTQILIKRMVSILERNRYRILYVRENDLVFDDDPWKLIWNFEAARRMSGGSFDVGLKDGSLTVTFSIYLSLISPICVLTALTILLFSNGEYYAPLFFLAFFTIGVTIQMVTIKRIAREMLREATDS